MTNPTSQQITQAQLQYVVNLAVDHLRGSRLPFDRIVEKCETGAGFVTRTVECEGALPDIPTVTSLAAGSPLAQRASETWSESISFFMLWPMRREQLLTDLVIECGDDKKHVSICPRPVCDQMNRRVLGVAWLTFKGKLTPALQARTAALLPTYASLAERSTEWGELAIASLRQQLETVNAPRDAIDDLLSIGRFFSRRRVLWARLPTRPGEKLLLTYSYRTRFAPEYVAHSRHRVVGSIWGGLKRYIGQEPSRFLIPVSRHTLARSYHFYMPMADDLVVRRAAFIQEAMLTTSTAAQDQAMAAFVRSNGAEVRGKSEAGGPYAHLYSFLLPKTRGNQVYADVRVMERPPGTLSVAFWLCLATLALGTTLFIVWDAYLFEPSIGGNVDSAAAVAALPGVAALWFGRAFATEGRLRIPIASRLALMAVGLTALWTLIVILASRTVCNGTPCEGAFSWLVSRQSYGIAMIMLALVLLLVLEQRLQFFFIYRSLQRRVNRRYHR